MRASIKIIKFVAPLSIAFLFLTYIISLNEENKWLVLDTPWLSNGFVFAVAGGSFASLVVILACELQKYFLLKHQIEDYTFGQLFALYTQITIIHYNTKRQLSKPNAPVPSNLIEEIATRGLMCLNNLNAIDYVTFKAESKINEVLNQLNVKNGMCIRSFLHNTVFLKIAINEDKMDMLKHGREEIITTSSPKTHLTLKKIFDDSYVVFSFMDKTLGQIDKECKYRYHWRDVKRSIISSEESFISLDLDSFHQTKIQID